MPVTLEELEFIVREYVTVTERLVEVMDQVPDEKIPRSILGALMLLSDAIEQEWG